MNKFFIPILIFLVIVFCLFRANDNILSNNNENTYENFVPDYFFDISYEDIYTIKNEIYEIKYNNYINTLKDYFGDFNNLISKHWGASLRNIEDFYENLITDTTQIDFINNYNKDKLYDNIFSKETHLSNFLLFVNPSHKMNIQFTNYEEIEPKLKNNNLRIQYKIKNVSLGKETSRIYSKDVAFHLYQSGKKYDTEEDLIDIDKFSLDLYDGKNFLDFQKYNVCYELPTRTTGNINSDTITSYLYLIPGDYEIDLIIEKKDKLENSDSINLTQLMFTDFNSEYFTISEQPQEFTQGDTVNKELMYDLRVYIYYMGKLLKYLQKSDDIDIDGEEINIKMNYTEETEEDFKIYIYNKIQSLHSKKIRDTLSCVIYIIKSELNKYLNENDSDYDLIVSNEENIKLINTFINEYFQEPFMENFSDFKDIMTQLQLEENEIKIKYLTQNHFIQRKNLNKLAEEIINKFNIDPYSDSDIKGEIEIIINKIDEFKNKKINEKYFVYTKKYIVNVKAEPLPPDPNFIPPVEVNYFEIKPRDILKSIQDDLRIALNERDKKKLDNYLSDNTIANLKRIDAISKSEGNDFILQRDANIKLKKFIMNILDKIKTGDFDLISKFLDYDIKNQYQYPDPIIEEFTSREKISDKQSVKYKRAEKQNNSQALEIKNKYKNKMNTIYNRLNMIRNTKLNNKVNYEIDDDEKLNSILKKGINTINRKDSIIEGFLPHKHTKEGQIRWNISPDLDNEQWLKKNYDTVADYKFIPKENKQQILKSYDEMEKNIKDTIVFVSDTFNNFDERVNIYEAERQKKINEAQNNFNTLDYERQRIEFEKKEKEQEKKTKSINEKMSQLEKINNKVFNDKTFKSISSYGDGQTLSIDNIEENIYTIKANKGCLSLDQNNKLKSTPCLRNDSQQFIINNIVNKDEYNKHLDTPVDDYSEVFYPFNIVKSTQNDKKCLSMKGSSLGIHDCRDTIYQRWDTKKLDKECRGDFLS